jgi:hypothetical protein
VRRPRRPRPDRVDAAVRARLVHLRAPVQRPRRSAAPHAGRPARDRDAERRWQLDLLGGLRVRAARALRARAAAQDRDRDRLRHPGKITDLSVRIDGIAIGVSVTRAFAFPLGTPYTVGQATTLIQRKLEDILVSTANVSAADRWQKQILAVLAYDDQAADIVAEAWNALDPAVKADSIVLVTATHGTDTFIYTDQ